MSIESWTAIPLFVVPSYNSIFSNHVDAGRCGGFFGRSSMCAYKYSYLITHWAFSELQSRCQFPFTFLCLLTSWIWFLGRSVWLQWPWPDRHLAMSGFPTHSSANGSQPRPWNTLCHSKPSVKNVLTLKSRLNTDMQYLGTFQNNPDRLPMCSKAPGAVITMSWHCVVIYTLKSNGILFISTIIWLNLRPLFLVLFDPWSSRRAASVLWLQGDCSDLGAGVVISCQTRLQSQGPTGNICQCPLHNTRFYGKIEPSSNCRGNSRASLLTDMSWKLASILEEIQVFFLLPHHHLLKIF